MQLGSFIASIAIGSFLLLSMLFGAQNPILLEKKEGITELLTSSYQDPFWKLINYYETQKTNSFCGVASSVMVLNALKVQRPRVEALGNQGLYTQENFFTPRVNQIVTEWDVRSRGMHFEEITKALASFPNVKVDMVYSNNFSLDQFRDLLKKKMRTPNTFVIVNYIRNYVGQSGRGHFSPVGAYNEKSDRVLILDVSRYRYTAAWVQLEDLYHGIAAISEGKNYSRGLVFVSA